MADYNNARSQFGTAPVFLTAISTILGAVMFLHGVRGVDPGQLVARFRIPVRDSYLVAARRLRQRWLMILLAYVILGNPDWRHGLIKVFATFPEGEEEEQQEKLLSLIRTGRVPIAQQNVEFVRHAPVIDRKKMRMSVRNENLFSAKRESNASTHTLRLQA